jgi:hypothetical protein
MLKKVLFILFVFLAFITQTIAEPGTNAILSRLTYSDIFGALGLIFGLKVLYTGFAVANRNSKVFQAALFMVFCFFLPILFSYNIQATVVECLILLFLVFVSISIFQLFKDDFITGMLPLIMYTLITASILGFYDLYASTIGLPRIFPKRTDGEALSGFRNAGQAGAYYLVNLAILLPLRFSPIRKLLKTRDKKLLDITLGLALVFFLLTGKVAAYVGLLVGVFMYIVYKRNAKYIIMVLIAIIGLVAVWNNLEELMPDTYNRISYKYDSRVVNSIETGGRGGFLEKNFTRPIRSFVDRPLVGSGIGGFVGPYGSHEVNSTYLKMLAETGLVGTFGYIILMLFVFLFFRKPQSHVNNIYYSYLNDILPFFIGCMVSWSYTYHLRKREFWILIAVLMITRYLARKHALAALEEPKSIAS